MTLTVLVWLSKIQSLVTEPYSRRKFDHIVTLLITISTIHVSFESCTNFVASAGPSSPMFLATLSTFVLNRWEMISQSEPTRSARHLVSCNCVCLGCSRLSFTILLMCAAINLFILIRAYSKSFTWRIHQHPFSMCMIFVYNPFSLIVDTLCNT